MKQSSWSQERDLIEAIEAGVRSGVLNEYGQDTCSRVLMLALALSDAVLQEAREWQRLFGAGGCKVYVVTATDQEKTNTLSWDEMTSGVFVYRAPYPSCGNVVTGDSSEVLRTRLAALASLVLAAHEPVTYIQAHDLMTAEAASWLAETSRVPLVTTTVAAVSLSGSRLMDKHPIRS